MRKTIFLWIILLGATSCTTSPIDCHFSKNQAVKEFTLDNFDRIEVNPMIQLTIYQSIENRIKIVTDKDIIDQIDFKISDHQLILTNPTDCLIENSDAIAEIEVYANSIKEIIANTELTITSGNTWRFNDLTIICDNVSGGTNNVADFNFEIDNNKLRIVSNGSSIYNVSGKCQNLSVEFYGSGPSFWGQNLLAKNIHIFQRSQADMHLFPIQSISGDLYGYGDIYLYNRPASVNIIQHYKGHIYYVN